MFAEMASTLSNPDFVQFEDLPNGCLFAGYTKPKESKKKSDGGIDEVEELGNITAGVGFVVGGDGGFGGAESVGFTPPVTQDPPIKHILNLSLEQLYSGCTKKMKISRKVLSANGGLSKEEKVVSVEVKPGWKRGTKVTFPKEGDQVPGKIPSDIIFVIDEKPHSKFKREGNNLHHKASITLQTALCGGLVEIPHINGHTENLPLRGVVGPDSEDVLQGRGMPVSRQPGKRGDLLVNYNITFPNTISDSDKKQLANILGKY